MSIVHLLSSSQERIDQQPNKDLAKQIIQTQDGAAIAELEQLLKSKKKNQLFDVLKTIEMIGEEAPEMIAHLFEPLSFCLQHPVNKIVWIGMSAMSHVSRFHPQLTYELLPKIIHTMENGGVIMRDKGFKMMVILYTETDYQGDLKLLMLEQLRVAPDNQFGQYLEKWIAVILKEDIPDLIGVIEERLPELTDANHRKRAEKNLKKLIHQQSKAANS